MKKDLATAIGTAVIGVILSYFICNLLIPPIESVKYKTIDATVSTSLAEPNPEVFNYKSLNPTVEVFVGTCDEYGENGECIDASDEIIPNENIEGANTEDTADENTDDTVIIEEQNEVTQE